MSEDENRYGWYDEGGALPPAPIEAVLHRGECILPAEQIRQGRDYMKRMYGDEKPDDA